MNSWQYRYDTGWINRSDFTNVHLGSDTTLNTDSNVTHNLNAPLSNLLVRVFISTDGTDANSFEAPFMVYNPAGLDEGLTIQAVDNNNLIIQTGEQGVLYLGAAGTGILVDTENWYYKVKIFFVG